VTSDISNSITIKRYSITSVKIEAIKVVLRDLLTCLTMLPSNVIVFGKSQVKKKYK